MLAMRSRSALTLALLSAVACHGRHCGEAEIKAKEIHGCVSLKHVRYMGHREAIWLGHALHHNAHLKVLDLHDTKLGDDDAIALANGLRNNSHLKRLHMHNNRIYDRGTAALGRALLENNCLEFLSLGSNGVGDEGAKGLAEGLRGNSMLRRLDLYLNLIGDEGAAALADALKLNKGLRMLHLDTNRIEEAGGLALAEAVRGTPVGLLGGRGAPPSLLGELGLMYNPLGSLAVEALIAAAKANPTIHALGLDHASGVKGAAARALEHEHQPRMHDRHRLAHFLVEQRLVMNEGFSDAQLWESQLDRPLADRKRGHGGWHSADGPPLASPLAAAVQQLRAHTHEGLLALRHTSEAQLRAHQALTTLPEAPRAALVRAVLERVQHAVQKDET